jgi:DUF4097 and DUF4098 domain-containing protein YvlB
MSQETINKTFNVATPARLTLSNIRGSVEILPGDDGTIQVAAVKHQKSGDPERTKITITQIDASHVSVKTDFRDGWFGFARRKPCKVDYTVQVPKECWLKVSGVSNSTEIQGVKGELFIKSVSGEIRLNDLSGPLKINSVSGSITGNRVVGSLDFNTVSGKISLKGSHFTCIDGHTVSGKINLQTPLGQGPYQFDAVSGDVELTVPADTACTASIRSLSGRINTSLSTTNSHINGGNSRLEINSGGVEVRSKSVSGNLFLKPAKDTSDTGINAPALSPRSQEEHSSPPETLHVSSHENNMEILERIANGEISVDEALEKIS